MSKAKHIIQLIDEIVQDRDNRVAEVEKPKKDSRGKKIVCMVNKKTKKDQELDKKQFVINSTQKSLTIDQLDALMVYCLSPKTGKFAWIVHCIKLIAICAYVYTRKQLVEDDWEASKQRYEKSRIVSNRNSVEE